VITERQDDDLVEGGFKGAGDERKKSVKFSRTSDQERIQKQWSTKKGKGKAAGEQMKREKVWKGRRSATGGDHRQISHTTNVESPKKGGQSIVLYCRGKQKEKGLGKKEKRARRQTHGFPFDWTEREAEGDFY